MGILDFFKGISKEEKKPVRKIKLEDAEKLISSFHEKIIKEANLNLKEIKEKITQEKKNIEENSRRLEEAEFKNKAFPDNVIPMMRDNRRTYIQKIKMFLKEIDLPDNVDKIHEKCIKLEHYFDEFGKSTIRNHKILQQYFGEKVSSLAENIVKIHKLIKEAEKVSNSSEIIKTNEMRAKFDEIQEEIKQKKVTEEKIKSEEEEHQKINKKITETEKKIKEKEEGERYKKLHELIEKKKNIEKEIREEEKEPLHSFSVINDALKKYERISLENKLIKEYLENPLKTLEEDKELKITDIIHSMKNLLMKNQIDLKEEKKEKTIHECNKINKNYLETVLGKIAELKRKIHELNSEIEKETIVKEIEELKEELRKEKIKESEVKHRIEKMRKTLEDIDINKQEKELEMQINKELNENVKII